MGAHTNDVIGVAGVRELMTLPPSAQKRVESICRPALMVPDTVALPVLVTQMQERRDEFACVLDEYGGFAGAVTLEDVAEEVVGDISDENDEADVGAVQRSGWWEIDAALRMDEVAVRTGITLPDTDDYETVAGLVVADLGRFAEPGDRLVVEAGRGRGTGRRARSRCYPSPDACRSGCVCAPSTMQAAVAIQAQHAPASRGSRTDGRTGRTGGDPAPPGRQRLPRPTSPWSAPDGTGSSRRQQPADAAPERGSTESASCR